MLAMQGLLSKDIPTAIEKKFQKINQCTDVGARWGGGGIGGGRWNSQLYCRLK